MPRVQINTESLEKIHRQLNQASYEIQAMTNKISMDVQMAEVEGWSDKTYVEFRDAIQDTLLTLQSSARKIEDEHIPYIKNLVRMTSDF